MNYYLEFNGKLNSRTEKYKNGKKHKYCTDIICFDIETTSAWIKDTGEITAYIPGLSAEYWNNLQTVALPYIWQVSINDTVYFGREFRDFVNFISKFPSDMDIIIWVHNLAFEFQFLCNLFHWKRIFARAPHKVITAVPVNFPNITFRCTYFLTRLSLKAWGDQLGIEKKTGDLLYNVLRTPYTTLTDTELGYCERDVIVMYHGIKQYVKQYGTLENIPLTQTGTVRREVKNRLTHDFKYMCYVKKLVPHDADEYAMLQRIFAGGYTHANRMYAGKVVKGKIKHFDFASAYPYVMLSEKYPDTPWTYIHINKIPNDFETNAYILHLHFTNIISIRFNTYIQASKISNGMKCKYDNGRLLSAENIEIWITEQDYAIIKESYEWETMEILHCYKSRKAYLPKPLLEYMLELYESKTKLKGVEGKEEIYLQAKQYINSLFGMMVTAILQSDIELKNDEWFTKMLTSAEIDAKLRDLKNISMNETGYFLSYSWGIYVTAYCRRNLWDCILKYDDITLYSDTDSAFILGDADFTEYNNIVYRKVNESCKANNLDIAKTMPCDIWGKKHPIGLFEEEKECSEFITLGAKRYCYRRADNEKLYLTISGINKEAVELLQNDLHNFKDGFVFDKDANCVRKQLLIYSCEQPEVTFPDGYKSSYRYGISMRNNGYKLSITPEYADLIHYLDIDIDNLSEAEYISRRGRFKRGD